MISRMSNNERSKGKMYYACPKTKKTNRKGKWDWGCGNFLWEDKSCSGGSSGSSSGSTQPSIPRGYSTPTTSAEKRVEALSQALEIQQNANRALVDVVRNLAKLPLDD
ncbi:hypothetical protein DCAR_0311811 [Daucus carota subsp. sativus]|uniref:Zinc finger GRF-type domain-containing protein n=1 Tax=Daucus carota subsp. sativus TaxID=79200 RepID=A0A162AJ22_DAUCS|nr:hypothetical protein DCAR_0311811 [Daucus carota subsp. sativus]